MATRTHQRINPSPTHTKTSYRPKLATGFAIIEQALEGVPTQQIDQLTQLLAMSLLQIAERTLHRFRNEGRLDEHSSERLLLLENLTAHDLLVFDGQANAFANWLRYPLRELKNQAQSNS